MSDRVTTRAKNQFAHPGLPDQAAPRRSHQQVANDLKDVAEQEDVERLNKEEKLRKLAAFEEQSRQGAIRTEAAANRPPETSTTKVLRTPSTASTVIADDDQAAGSYDKEDADMDGGEGAGDVTQRANKNATEANNTHPPYYHSKAERKAIAQQIKKRTAELKAHFDASIERSNKRKVVQEATQATTAGKKTKVEEPAHLTGTRSNWRDNIDPQPRASRWAFPERNSVDIPASMGGTVSDEDAETAPSQHPNKVTLDQRLAWEREKSDQATKDERAARRAAFREVLGSRVPPHRYSDDPDLMEDGGLHDEDDSMEIPGPSDRSAYRPKSHPDDMSVDSSPGPIHGRLVKHAIPKGIIKSSRVTVSSKARPTPTVKFKGQRIPLATIELSDSEDERAIANSAKMLARKASFFFVNFLVANMVGVGARTIIKQEAQELPTAGHRTRSAHKSFTNRDLPPETLDRWREFYIPMWTEYIGTRSNPWDTDLLDKAQELWNKVFPTHHQELSAKGPIFQLALQRVCEWRGSFATDAIVAVDRYWKEQAEHFLTAKDRADFVGWAAPQEPDARAYPFLYATVDRDPWMKHSPELGGPFLSKFVLRSLTSHLKSIAAIPVPARSKEKPIGATALATAAAERAMLMWSSGSFVKPDSKDVKTHFSHHKWGDNVDAYVISLQAKTEKAWGKMLAHAYQVMEADNPNNKTIPYSSAQAQASSGQHSGRAMCVESESESEDPEEL